MDQRKNRGEGGCESYRGSKVTLLDVDMDRQILRTARLAALVCVQVPPSADPKLCQAFTHLRLISLFVRVLLESCNSQSFPEQILLFKLIAEGR